jgi:hypothetical protein
LFGPQRWKKYAEFGGDARSGPVLQASAAEETLDRHGGVIDAEASQAVGRAQGNEPAPLDDQLPTVCHTDVNDRRRHDEDPLTVAGHQPQRSEFDLDLVPSGDARIGRVERPIGER